VWKLWPPNHRWKITRSCIRDRVYCANDDELETGIEESGFNGSVSWGNLIPLTACAFIAMGALALCKIPALQSAVLYDPVPSLNLSWELGFFTYGLWCLAVSWGANPCRDTGESQSWTIDQMDTDDEARSI
jgi:hypothetical protein